MRRARVSYAAGALVLLLPLGAAWLRAGPEVKSVPNELPRSWSLEEIAKETPPYGTEGRVYVLAWKIIEDDRPLRVESCLVLKVLDKNEGYELAHLYRHPADKKPEWQLSMTHVSGEKGTKYYPGLWIHHCERFKDRPGNKELYASLSVEGVGWTFDQEKGWRFVGCGVCEKSWAEAIGEKPTRFFGK
jgi:hypothetical protein